MADDLDDWIVELADALGIDVALIDRDLILDLARDAAHAVARPAAPLTTFMVGLAAGHRGASIEVVRAAVETAQRLAEDRG